MVSPLFCKIRVILMRKCKWNLHFYFIKTEAMIIGNNICILFSQKRQRDYLEKRENSVEMEKTEESVCDITEALCSVQQRCQSSFRIKKQKV